VAQWVRSLDITIHTSLSPIRARLCKLQKRVHSTRSCKWTFIIIFFFFSFTFWIFGFLTTKSRPLLGLCISFFVHRCFSSHILL
jgi:hypothetical protein